MIEQRIVEAFLLDRTMNGASDETIATYRKRLSFLARAHGDAAPAPAPIILTIRAMTCGDAMKAGYWRAARAWLNFAMSHNLIPSERMPRVRFRKPPPRVPPTNEELDRLIGSIGAGRWILERNRLLMMLYAYCGCRNSELRGLRRRDVHLGQRIIAIVGKGNRPRQVPIIDQVAEALAAWLETHTDDYVFPRARGGGMLARDTISKIWHEIQEQAGGDRIYRVHDLRHYFAAYLRRKRVDLGIIGNIMGHSSIIVTEMVYGHLQTETAHAAMQDAMTAVKI